MLETAQAVTGLDSSDVWLAVGSVVEGLENSTSDLDLILASSREENAIPSGELAFVVGTCLCHVQVLSLRRLQELMARFDEWGGLPWDTTYLPSFSLDDRRLLHRLLHSAVLLGGPDSPLHALLPDLNSVARLKLQVARHVARTVQLDMAGSRNAGDYMTFVFAAQELLGHAADALTAGYALTNPTPKWRSRLLERVPADWEQRLRIRPTGMSAPDLFWALHRAPGRPTHGPALAYGLQIATFARAVFVWAERHLVWHLADSQSTSEWARRELPPQEPPLPHLDIDVDFAQSNGWAALGRLNNFNEPLSLSLPEFEITHLFDGSTTATEAAAAIFGAECSESDRRVVDGVLARVAHAGLSVSRDGPGRVMTLSQS